MQQYSELFYIPTKAQYCYLSKWPNNKQRPRATCVSYITAVM